MNLTAVIEDIRHALEYASYREDSFRADAKKGKGNRAVPPVCTKGAPCGFSCISKNLNYRKTLTDLSPSNKSNLDALGKLVKKDFAKTRWAAVVDNYLAAA